MYASFLLYSFVGVFSKFAAMQAFLSFFYILYFLGIIFILAVYAILWQYVLKNIHLSVAMSNKPICLILSTFWGMVIFKETITIKTLIGIILILCGIFTICRSGHEK